MRETNTATGTVLEAVPAELTINDTHLPVTKHDSCILCNSKKLNTLDRYKETHLVKCGGCGFVFSSAIPTAQELNDYYTESYSRTDYLSPLTVKRYHEILDSFEPFRKTNKIIDVGCGVGFFLEVAKERGWEVYGTEYTDDALEICRAKGITMHQGVLNPDNFDPEMFDIVTSFEVIEHINNPQPELANFHKILRSGGLVYVTTPNFNSLLRYRLKERYDVITYPEHLSYYTHKTLKKIFRKSGFKTQSVRTTGISFTRLKTSQGKSNQEYVSETSDDELMRHKIEKRPLLKFAKNFINWWLNVFKVGDSLKGRFIKV